MASTPTQPNPALIKKVRKVLEMRTDAPELSSALQDLSEFYGQNTLENRRNLRSSVEKRGIEISKNLVRAFSDVVEQLDKVDADVQTLANTCEVMKAKVKESQHATVKLMTISDRLAAKQKTAQIQQKLSTGLLEKLRLSDEETQVICNQTMTPRFFEVLTKLEKLQHECKQILRTHHKRALLELIDEMALLHDTAYERLYQFLLERIRALEEEVTDVAPIMQQGVRALSTHTALFQMCVEELSATRHLAIIKRFINALTIGGRHGVPRAIDMNAHDPLRYIGDICAWIHQALASEADLLRSVFGRNSAEQKHVDVILDQTFSALCTPLYTRVESILETQSDIVSSFKLSNLLQFYLQTISQHLPADAALTTTLLQCNSITFNKFRSHLERSAEITTAQQIRCPADLSPPAAVITSLAQLTELLQSFSTSLVPAKMREANFRPVIESTVDPLLSLCALHSHTLSAEEAAVFLTNIASITISALEGYDFVGWRVELLKQNISTYTDAIVREQLNMILRRCTLDDKISKLRNTNCQLSAAAGMDEVSLSLSLKQFYSLVFSATHISMPICDSLTDPAIRRLARSQVSSVLADIYEDFYDAVHADESGYSNPSLLAPQSKSEIRSVLTNAS